MFWLVYMVFQFVQPNEIKYNSYIGTKHPDWGFLNADYQNLGRSVRYQAVYATS